MKVVAFNGSARKYKGVSRIINALKIKINDVR